jgi:hypothetical protein
MLVPACLHSLASHDMNIRLTTSPSLPPSLPPLSHSLYRYKPHSSLHPHWRQAQHVFSRSFDHDDGDSDGGRGRGVSAVAAAGAAPGVQERLELLFGQDNRDTDGPWEVTLQPGDMLYVLCYTIVLPFFSCLCCLSLPYQSITACLHSLILHGTSLTIISSPPQPIINRHNTRINYHNTGTCRPTTTTTCARAQPAARP